MQVTREKGFSLVELLIVMLIISIAMAFAVTSYTSYLIRGNRADVKKEMIIIAQKLAAYRLANNDYGANSTYASNVLLNPAIYAGTTFPAIGTPIYNFTITGNLLSTWVLQATPVGTQATDGDIKYNNQGWHCWTKGVASCTLSATSSWD